MLLAEVGLKRTRRASCRRPVDRLLRGYYAAAAKFTSAIRHAAALTDDRRQRGAGHPFDPKAPAISSDIPLLIGYNRTEETLFHRAARFSIWTMRD